MSNFYGLIGEKLSHSFSPKIHNLILQNTNSNAVYNLFEINREDLKSAVRGLKALGCMGANVTIPYKVKLIEYLDSLSHEAKKIGAINTVSFINGELKGYNTDYNGFGEALKKANIDVKNRNAVILGTGGASKAVVQYLEDNDITEVVFVSRDPKSKPHIEDYKIISYEDLRYLKNQDIIINCTPCGMYPNNNDCLVDKNVLSKFSSAVDLIYNPAETVFLKQANEIGIKSVNGLYMLVTQATAAHEIWQKIKIEKELVDKIYDKLK